MKTFWRYFPIFLILQAACSANSDHHTLEPNKKEDLFELSAQVLNFEAESLSLRLRSKSITVDIVPGNSQSLYFKIESVGSAVETISKVYMENLHSGTFYVSPFQPGNLGIGDYSSVITVTACLDDPTCTGGTITRSSKSINVFYSVKALGDENIVMPSVAIAEKSGDAIIRGNNFIADYVSQVFFGDFTALHFTVISDTEIHATYPPLSVGAYSINLDALGGGMPSGAFLNVIEPFPYAAGILKYPKTPQQTLKILFDDKREALFVAASYFDGNNYNKESRMQNQIFRYQFIEGKYVSFISVDIPLLQDMELSPDRNQLLVITDSQFLDLNPLTLEQASITNHEQLLENEYFRHLAVTNEGNALITTGYYGSGFSPTFLYRISTNSIFETINPCEYEAMPGASKDGAYVVFIQGLLSPPPSLCFYNASSGKYTESTVNLSKSSCSASHYGTCYAPVFDHTGQRIAISHGYGNVDIYDRTLVLLGSPAFNSPSIAFNADGTLLYAYDSVGSIRIIDLQSANSDKIFPERGQAIKLIGYPGSTDQSNYINVNNVVRITTSIDSKTLFIAGSEEVVIQPVP